MLAGTLSDKYERRIRVAFSEDYFIAGCGEAAGGADGGGPGKGDEFGFVGCRWLVDFQFAITDFLLNEGSRTHAADVKSRFLT